MAKFYEVHRQAINAAFHVHTFRSGDYFRIAVQEPLKPVDLTSDPVSESHAIQVVAFVRTEGQRFLPVRGSREIIDDWNERHAETDAESFGSPDYSEVE